MNVQSLFVKKKILFQKNGAYLQHEKIMHTR